MIRYEWANAHPKISSMFTYKSVTLILQQNILVKFTNGFCKNIDLLSVTSRFLMEKKYIYTYFYRYHISVCYLSYSHHINPQEIRLKPLRKLRSFLKAEKIRLPSSEQQERVRHLRWRI